MASANSSMKEMEGGDKQCMEAIIWGYTTRTVPRQARLGGRALRLGRVSSSYPRGGGIATYILGEVGLYQKLLQ